MGSSLCLYLGSSSPVFYYYYYYFLLDFIYSFFFFTHCKTLQWKGMASNKVLPDVPVLPRKRPPFSECFMGSQQQGAAVSSSHVATYSRSRVLCGNNCQRQGTPAGMGGPLPSEEWQGSHLQFKARFPLKAGGERGE